MFGEMAADYGNSIRTHNDMMDHVYYEEERQ